MLPPCRFHMWTVRADPFSGSCCPALSPAVGAVGEGQLQGAWAPRGPRKPPSWISPCSLCLLLLIGIYLHKKDPCQDHHSSLVHMAQSPVTQRMVVCWTGGRREGNCRAWCDQGLHPEPLTPPGWVWCQDQPLLCPAQEVQGCG